MWRHNPDPGGLTAYVQHIARERRHLDYQIGAALAHPRPAAVGPTGDLAARLDRIAQADAHHALVAILTKPDAAPAQSRAATFVPAAPTRGPCERLYRPLLPFLLARVD